MPFFPSRWDPRTFIPRPATNGTKAEAFEVAALLSRGIAMIRRAIPAFVALIALSQTATAGVSCAVVRFYVAKYSEAAAETWARSHGASDAEIETARRCLHHRANVQIASSAAGSQVLAPVTQQERARHEPNERDPNLDASHVVSGGIRAPTPRRIVMATNHAFMASSARRISRLLPPGIRATRLRISFPPIERLPRCVHAMCALCIVPTVGE